MNNGFLSQEEIDLLLSGGGSFSEDDTDNTKEESELSEIDKDLLGEIGNISMGSASTALSTIIGSQVNITTPVVTITTLKELKDNFEVPNIALEVKFTSGIMGENLLVMKMTDAAVIANLMMGGDGKVDKVTSLSELEESAVSEAMNQMIGSAATSMATMFAREVNISPPTSRIWDDLTAPLTDALSDDEPIVKVSFTLNIGELVDSTIMQLLPIKTARKIVSIMMGNEEPVAVEKPQEKPEVTKEVIEQVGYREEVAPKTITEEKPVEVKHAAFQPLNPQVPSKALPSNIDLIMDVPLEISVVLGRTKLNIKEILNLGTGSLIELDKLAEEPVEILVNGKMVAFGEVVVIDENFGVRITSIVSNEEKIKSLGK